METKARIIETESYICLLFRRQATFSFASGPLVTTVVSVMLFIAHYDSTYAFVQMGLCPDHFGSLIASQNRSDTQDFLCL